MSIKRRDGFYLQIYSYDTFYYIEFLFIIKHSVFNLIATVRVYAAFKKFYIDSHFTEVYFRNAKKFVT